MYAHNTEQGHAVRPVADETPQAHPHPSHHTCEVRGENCFVAGSGKRAQATDSKRLVEALAFPLGPVPTYVRARHS